MNVEFAQREAGLGRGPIQPVELTDSRWRVGLTAVQFMRAGRTGHGRAGRNLFASRIGNTLLQPVVAGGRATLAAKATAQLFTSETRTGASR